MNPFARLDAYDRQHLAAHLESAGREVDLHRLLEVETHAGRNAWFEARQEVKQTQGYLDDVQRAWRAARRSPGGAHSLQYHYALAVSSINSQAGRVSPSFLARLVQLGVLDFDQGRTYALQTPRAEQRAAALAALAQGALPAQQDALLEAALSLVEEADRGAALEALAPHLGQSQARQVFSAAQALIQAGLRGRVCLQLINHLSGELQYEALQATVNAVNQIEDIPAKVKLAVETGALLEEPGRGNFFQTALSMIEQLRYTMARARALEQVAPSLVQHGYLQDVLEIVFQTMNMQYAQEVVLKSIAAYLPESTLLNLLDYYLKLKDRQLSVQGLLWIAPHLPNPKRQDQLKRAFRLGNSMNNPAYRPTLWGNIARSADLPLLERVRRKVNSLQAGVEKDELLIRLSDRYAALGESESALRLAGRVVDPSRRAAALAGLASAFSGTRRARVITRALQAAEAIRDEKAWEEFTTAMALAMDATFARKALELSTRIIDRDYQAWALVSLLYYAYPDFVKNHIDEAVHETEAIQDADLKAFTIVSLWEHLIPTLQTRFFSIAMATLPGCRPSTRQHLLAYLAKYSSTDCIRDLLEEFDQIAESYRPDTLTQFAPRLELDQLFLALELAEPMSSYHRQTALVSIYKRMAQLDPELALERVIHAQPVDLQARLWEVVAPHLPEKILPFALQTATNLGDSLPVASLAALLLRQVALGNWQAAWQHALGYNDPKHRAELLLRLAPEAPAEAQATTLDAAWPDIEHLDTPVSRLSGYIALLPLIPEPQRDHKMDETVALAQEIITTIDKGDESAVEDEAIEALRVLSEYSPEPTRIRILDACLRFTMNLPARDFIAGGLVRLAPSLTQPLIPKAIDYARKLDEESVLGNARAVALTALAERLLEFGEYAEALETLMYIHHPLDRAVAGYSLMIRLDDKQVQVEDLPISQSLRAHASLSRRDVFSMAHWLAPVIAALEDGAGIEAMYRAIERSVRWWA